MFFYDITLWQIHSCIKEKRGMNWSETRSILKPYITEGFKRICSQKSTGLEAVTLVQIKID